MAVAHSAFQTLLGHIMTFRIEPYVLLSEQAMADELGVSRTPVREALARLAGLGLVDIYPQRGSVVAPLRLNDLHKSQFLREALEVALVARATLSAERPALLKKLGNELALQQALASIGDKQRFFAADELFHQHLAAYAGLPDVWTEISAAKLHMDRFRHLAFPALDDMNVVTGQHRRIVAAIEQGASHAAQAAMRDHLRRIFLALDAIQCRHADYFTTADRPEPARIRRYQAGTILATPIPKP